MFDCHLLFALSFFATWLKTAMITWRNLVPTAHTKKLACLHVNDERETWPV